MRTAYVVLVDCVPAAASRRRRAGLTGALIGTVKDAQGGVLPVRSSASARRR